MLEAIQRPKVILAFAAYAVIVVVVSIVSFDFGTKLLAGLVGTLFTILILDEVIAHEQRERERPVLVSLYSRIGPLVSNLSSYMSMIASHKDYPPETWTWLENEFQRIKQELVLAQDMGANVIPLELKNDLLELDKHITELLWDIDKFYHPKDTTGFEEVVGSKEDWERRTDVEVLITSRVVIKVMTRVGEPELASGFQEWVDSFIEVNDLERVTEVDDKTAVWTNLLRRTEKKE